MEVIITICSKEKNQNTKLIPAKERYSSPRINIVEKIAKQKKLPFYLFSCKYGIIKSDTPIPLYNHQLEQSEVDLIIPKLIKQLKKEDISKIIFYGKSKVTKDWATYYEAIEKASETLKIPLVKNTLNDY